MEPVNILNSYGLTNGLANFFKSNHSVLIERNPYVTDIIRVTIGQTTNTPGVMSPLINVNPEHKYRLTVTGYTKKGTHAFIAIMNGDHHTPVDCPVYLKEQNRDVVLEFSTSRDVDSIKIFIVVADPQLRQKFYISDIRLVNLGRVVKEEPVCPIPTEPPKPVIEPCEAVVPAETKQVEDEAAPSKVENLSHLLSAFHTYNKINEMENNHDTRLTPVVITSHAKDLPLVNELATEDDDCYCDTWREPMPCIMNVYNNSFSMNCFNPMSSGCGGGGHSDMGNTGCCTETKVPNIQLENIDLGIRVTTKQLKLLKVYLKHLERLNDIITESYNSLQDDTAVRDNDNLMKKITNIITELNFISLATETDVHIFTPHYDALKMPTLIIDCRGKVIKSLDYNVKIERYELGTRANDIDEIPTLLFKNIDTNDSWRVHHDDAYNYVSTLTTNIKEYHNTAVLQCDTLTNRKAVLD